MLILQWCSACRCCTKIFRSSALSQSALSPCARRNFKSAHWSCGGTDPLCSAHFWVPVGCTSRNGKGIVGCTSRSCSDQSGLCATHKPSASSTLALQAQLSQLDPPNRILPIGPYLFDPSDCTLPANEICSGKFQNHVDVHNGKRILFSEILEVTVSFLLKIN